MKSVLMVIDNYFPTIGGTQNQLRILCQALHEKGIGCRVVTERFSAELPLEERIDATRVVRIPFPKIKFLGSLVLLVQLGIYIFKMRHHYSIIHVHLVEILTLVACPLGRLLKKPVVLKFAGSDDALDRGPESSRRGFRAILFRLMRWSMRKADAGIAVSREMQAALIRNGFPEERIVLIPNGVTVAPHDRSPSRRDHMRKAVETAADFVVISVGRLVDEKDYPNLLRAWQLFCAQVPDAELIVVGDGELRSMLEDQCRKLGLNRTVRFAGTVNNVIDYLVAADLFVLSSKSEGFPNALLEAMAAGCPVIATDSGGVREVICHEKDGLIVPISDSQSLFEAMHRVYRQRDLLRAMGESGYRSVRQLFSIDAVADRHIRLYERLLESRSTPR